jgi:hypothetical protein
MDIAPQKKSLNSELEKEVKMNRQLQEVAPKNRGL